MRFIKSAHKAFSHAKAVAVSTSFIVSLSGGQARIYDAELNLLHTIKNLKCVYKCFISPDEQHLLLISITNCFYIVSLKTFEITKRTVKGKYTDNLEGRGCWTLDGKGCLLCVTNKDSIKSALRIYPDIASGDFYELLCDQYWLTSVAIIPEHSLYLITGYDRDNFKSYLIWFDGEKFEKCLIDVDNMIGATVDAKYIAEKDLCIVRCTGGTIACDANGKVIEEVTLPNQRDVEFSFADVFQKIRMNDEKRDRITELSGQLGFEQIQIPDQVIDICYSETNPYLYIGTLQDLICVDIHTHMVETAISCPFGVRRIVEINRDFLLIETWDSVEIVQICHEG